ncbi:MAG: hypothetical protein ACLFVP_07690 [Candidatus Bathyarchaeia archaeon]
MFEDSYGRKSILMNLLGFKKEDKEYLELVVFFDNKPGMIKKVSDVLTALNANILEGFHDVIDNRGVWGTFLEMEPSTPYEEEIESAIKIPGVQDIKYHKLKKSEYFERFFFPLGMERLRLLVLTQSAFQRMTKGIVNTFGSGGEALIYNEGKALAVDMEESLGDILETLESPKERLEFVSCVLRATGWGIMDFEGLNLEEGVGFIDVKENAETIEGYSKQCHFTRGMLTQVLRTIIKDPELELRETRCIGNGAPSCRYSII